MNCVAKSMLLNSRTGKNARDFVERKLLLRLKLFFGVFALLVIVIFYEVARDHIRTSTAIGAIMVGMMVGAILFRRQGKN